MGFNFGAFAGAAAKSGVDTYLTMTDVQRKEREMALREAENERQQNLYNQQKTEWEKGQRLDEAYANTQGRVGSQDYTGALQTATGMNQQQAQQLRVNTGAGGEDFDRAVNQSTASVALENKARIAARQQGLPTDDVISPTGYGAVKGPQSEAIEKQAKADAAAMKPTTYTQEQATKDYIQEASKVSRKGGLEAIQMKSAMRASKQEDDEDAFKQKLIDSQTKISNMVNSGDAQGLVKEAQSHGLDVRLEKGDKGAQAFVTYGKDGKETGRYSSIDAAGHAAGEALTHHLMKTEGVKVFGSIDKMASYLQGERKIGIEERGATTKEGELAVHKEMYGKGGTYERVHNAANAAANARGSEKSITARAKEYADALVEAGTVNPATKQPYTPEEAKKYALSVALHDPNAKAKSAWTMSADGAFRSNAEGVVQDFDTKTNAWKTRGLPEVSVNASKLGVIADVGSNGQVGFKGKEGWYSSEQEAVESFKAKKTESGIPNKDGGEQKADTARYTRTKTNRGTYQYSVNPRSGKTKAEWAELGASK